MTNSRKLLRTAIISITAIGIPASAAFADSSGFTYNKAELETDYNVERLYDRLTHFAEVECGTPGRVPIAVKAAERACEAELTEFIVAEIDHPRLDRHVERLTGRTQITSN